MKLIRPLSLVIFAAVAAFAQASDPRFEVASVKVNHSGDPGGSMRTTPGGSFTAVNSTFRAFLRYAYNVKDFQIEAAPAWFESARFDITAKAPGKASTPELRIMVQHLLEDRFALQLHRETRQVPAYELTRAKKGVLLKENTEGDSTVASSPGEIRAERVPMRILVNQLAAALGRPVIDKTELPSKYDFKLTWSPEPPAGDAPAPGPSIFTAIQEQLGLRLEAGKAPAEVLVIESANRTPKEN